MATMEQLFDHDGRPSGSVAPAGRRHGEDTLAEIIELHPARTPRAVGASEPYWSPSQRG